MSTVERYVFTNGWTMWREVVAPHFWLLFNVDGERIDRDQYRNDLIPRHHLTVKEHVDPDALVSGSSTGGVGR